MEGRYKRKEEARTKMYEYNKACEYQAMTQTYIKSKPVGRRKAKVNTMYDCVLVSHQAQGRRKFAKMYDSAASRNAVDAERTLMRKCNNAGI